MKKLSILVLFFILLISCSDNQTSDDDSIGADWYNKNDTEFVITTAKELAELAQLVNNRNNFKDKTVKLGADIMLNDTANWQDWANNPPTNEWVPIGSSDVRMENGSLMISGGVSFEGIFDGNGYVISGAYVNSTEPCKGLFGAISGVGIVEKLGVVASYINGDVTVGGLIGCNYGTINNSYFIGIVNGRNGIGGLVGLNEGTISKSYSNGTVTGTDKVGGLVGYNKRNIINSHSSCTVAGKQDVGGLVGYSYDGNFDVSNISNSYSTGNVRGEENVGGLVGHNGVGNVNNSYSTGNVEGEKDIGGFIGRIYHPRSKINSNYSTGAVTGSYYVGGFVGFSEGTISNSYSIGKVTGDSILGGFSGRSSYMNGEIKNSYYDVETSDQSKASGHKDEYYNWPVAKGKTTAEMKQDTTFEDWDFNDIWGISDTINDGYPYLIQ